MSRAAYTELLAEFVSGHINLPASKNRVDDMLFALRQNPDMTPEKRDLSLVQLYLHESAEGHREPITIYQLAWRLLDA